MSGESRVEGRLGYESTRERALVWVGFHLETNELVPWSSLTIGDHWASPEEFQRRSRTDRERREASERAAEEKRMRVNEAAIARELEASLKEDERVRVERDKERAKELEKERRKSEAESKSNKKKRKKAEVEMPPVDFFTDFVADEHQEPFRKDLPAVDVCGVEDDYGRVRAAREHYLEEVIPDIWLSWLWFRRYILSYPLRCDQRCLVAINRWVSR
jgi:hypothetical protein